MSRPRKYAAAAEAKRQAPDALADVPEDDDSEQFDWMDAKQPDEPSSEGMQQ